VLRKDEPHPVCALLAGSQIGERGVIGRPLRVDES